MIEMVQQEHLIIGGIAGGLTVIALCISAIIGTIAFIVCLRKWRERRRNRANNNTSAVVATTTTIKEDDDNNAIKGNNNNSNSNTEKIILTTSNGYSTLRDDDDNDLKESRDTNGEEGDEQLAQMMEEEDEDDGPLQLTVPPKQPQGIFNVSSRLLSGRQGTPRREKMSIHPFSPLTPDEETITDVDVDDDYDEREHLIDQMSDIDDDEDDGYATEEEASLLLPQNILSDDDDDEDEGKEEEEQQRLQILMDEEESARQLHAIIISKLTQLAFNDMRLGSQTFSPIVRDEEIEQEEVIDSNEDSSALDENTLDAISMIQAQTAKLSCEQISLSDIHALQSIINCKGMAFIMNDPTTSILQATIQTNNTERYYQQLKLEFAAIQACHLQSVYPTPKCDDSVSACIRTRHQFNTLSRDKSYIIVGQSISRSSLIHLDGHQSQDDFLVLLSAFRKSIAHDSAGTNLPALQACVRANAVHGTINPIQSLQATLRKHDTFISEEYLNLQLTQSLMSSCFSKDIVQFNRAEASLLQSQIRLSLIKQKSDENSSLEPIIASTVLQCLFRTTSEIQQSKFEENGSANIQADFRREITLRKTNEFLAHVTPVNSLFKQGSISPNLNLRVSIIVLQARLRFISYNLEPLHRMQSVTICNILADEVAASISTVTSLEGVCRRVKTCNAQNQLQTNLQTVIRGAHSRNNLFSKLIDVSQINSVLRSYIPATTASRNLISKVQAITRTRSNHWEALQLVTTSQSIVQSRMVCDGFCDSLISLTNLLSCSRQKANFHIPIHGIVHLQAVFMAAPSLANEFMSRYNTARITAIAHSNEVESIANQQVSALIISAVISSRLQFNDTRYLVICQSRIRSEILYISLQEVYTHLISLEANLRNTTSYEAQVRSIVPIQAACRVKPVSTFVPSLLSSIIRSRLLEYEQRASMNVIDELQTIVVTTIRTNLGVEENAKLFQAAITLYPALLRTYSFERYAKYKESLRLLQSASRMIIDTSTQDDCQAQVPMIQARLRSRATADTFSPNLQPLQANIRASFYACDPERCIHIIQTWIRQQLAICFQIGLGSSVITIQAVSKKGTQFFGNLTSFIPLQSNCRTAPRVSLFAVDKCSVLSLSSVLKTKHCVSEDLRDVSSIQAIVTSSDGGYDLRNVIHIQSKFCSSVTRSVGYSEVTILQAICRMIALGCDVLSDISMIGSILRQFDPRSTRIQHLKRVIVSQSNIRRQASGQLFNYDRRALTSIQSIFGRVESPIRPLAKMQSHLRSEAPLFEIRERSNNLTIAQSVIRTAMHIGERNSLDRRVNRLESVLIGDTHRHIHLQLKSVMVAQALTRGGTQKLSVLELSRVCNEIQSFFTQYETCRSLASAGQPDHIIMLQARIRMCHIPEKQTMALLPLQASINGSGALYCNQMEMQAILYMQSRIRCSLVDSYLQVHNQLVNTVNHLYWTLREQDRFRSCSQDVLALQSTFRLACIEHHPYQLLRYVQARFSMYSTHSTYSSKLQDVATLQTAICQTRLDYSPLHSCQAVIRMTGDVLRYSLHLQCALVLQGTARSKPVHSQYLTRKKQLLQGITCIQACINAKLTSDDSLTQVYKRDEGEKELISTKNTLQKLYVNRLDQLDNGFDTGRVLETSRLALNQASQAIKECLDKKSETLDLSRMNLSSLPPELALCRHVKSLSLNNNEISMLPYWFADTFKGLTHLDLSNNRLFELPEGFDQMKKLKHLDISHNKMEYFPNDLMETKLETLNISHNSLLLIPSDIGNMSELTHLDISNNSLMALPEEFSELKKLKALCVDNNKFLQSEIANVARIFTPLMRTPHDKRGLINLMRSNDQLGYINTVSRKRSGSGGSVKSPGMSTEEFTDINDMTELMDGSLYEIDYDEETASWNGSPPSLRIHGRNIDKLSPQSQSSEDDATDYGYDSDSSIATSISGVSTSALSPTITPVDRVLVVPQLNLSVQPYKGIADEDDLSSMDSPISSSATPRSKRVRTTRRSSRVFAYEQRPELSPIYQMLLDEDTRKKFRQFCQQESAMETVNCIDFWEGALVYKIFPDISSRKNKVAELYYSYLSSVGDKRLSVPTNLVDMITVQLEEELFRYKNKLPQLEEEPLPFYLLSGVISAVQDSMSPMIQKFKLANGIQSPADTATNTNPTNIHIVTQEATPRKEFPMREQSVRLRPISLQLQSIDKVDKQTIRELASLKKERKIDYKERINLLFEILESERKYVKFLQVLLDLYYEPIRENKNTGLKSGLFTKRLVSEKSAKKMFPPNLKTIIAFNLSFLRKLEQRFGMYQDKDPVAIYFMMIADLFIKATPYLDVYISYLTMYETAMGAIRQYRVKHKEFDIWINKRKKDKKCSGLDMGSLLIMPVQRIPRYKILLENLLKQTPPDHGDYDNLVRAIEMISECALLHNEKIRETNNHIKVQQIGKMLKMDDLAIAGRRLIREGNCFMNDTKQKAYLFNDIIILREKKKLSLVPTLRTYSLVEAVITGGSKESISLQANSLSSADMKDKNVDLSFDSYETKVAWLKDMATAISNLDENSSKSQIKPLTARTLTQRLRKTIALPLNSGRKRSPSDGQSALIQ